MRLKRGTRTQWVLVGSLVGGMRVTATRNCSIRRCYNAENICGKFQNHCTRVARLMAGPEIWVKVDFSFTSDHWFKRTELGSFSKEACEKDDNWMKIEYEGEWHEHGGSTTMLGLNMARVDMKSTWISLMKDKVCIEQQVMSRLKQCLNTFQAMQDLCPCNGWDWSTSMNGAPVTRNIGMFCSPSEQCPVLHTVLVQSTHYFSYNATVESACLSRVASSKERGWVRPEDENCFRKTAQENCLGGNLQVVGASSPFTSPLLIVRLLVAFVGISMPAAVFRGDERRLREAMPRHILQDTW